MKKLFLLCIFMVYLNSMFAQDYLNICATPDDNTPDPPGVFSKSIDANHLANMSATVFNVYYWRVNDQFGNIDPLGLTENQALAGIANLNIIFNPIGIFYKYRGMGSFNSPPDLVYKQYNFECGTCENFPFDPVDPCNTTTTTIDPDGFSRISRCQLGQFSSYVNDNNYKEPNAINIYVANTTDFGGASLSATVSLTHPGGLTSTVLIHELGHNLGLSHTFSGWHSNSPNYEGCEHVTRDPNNPNFNANLAGDRVTDTAAMPDFRREYCFLNGLPNSQCNGASSSFGFYYYNTATCEYEGTINGNNRADCQGTAYDISSADAQNYMGYNSSGCSNNFTIGQGVRMKERIASYAPLQAVTTTVSSLFEPYAGSYYNSGPLLPAHKPLFQPGFDYNFLQCQCDCPQPSDDNTPFTVVHNPLLTISKYETDYSSITHPNHSAIHIPILPNGSQDVGGPNIRRCYDNWNKAASGGKVTKFLDGVLNTNVTITPQDSTAINNNQLIDNLAPGLYNVEKNYNDGSSEQQVILKSGN